MKKQNHTKLALILSLLITMLVLSGCGRMMHRMMHRMDQMHGERFGEMHNFGERMMPFGFGDHGDMMAGVSHIFESTDDGVVYQVIAENVEDAETIAMIQERLSQQVEAMNAGMDAVSEEAADEAGDEEADEANEDEADEANEEETDEANEEETDEEATDADDEEASKNAQKDNDRHGRLDLNRGPFMRGFSEFMGEVDVSYTDLPDGGEIAITSENPDVVEMLHGWIEDGPMGRQGRR